MGHRAILSESPATKKSRVAGRNVRIADHTDDNARIGCRAVDKLRITVPHGRLIAWSLAISTVINAFLLSSAFVGGRDSNYVKTANAIAAPPSVIANRFLAPKEHSAGAFVYSALFALAFSFLFYAIVSWLFVQAIARLKSWHRNAG
jgi:hypothetical protein